MFAPTPESLVSGLNDPESLVIELNDKLSWAPGASIGKSDKPTAGIKKLTQKLTQTTKFISISDSTSAALAKDLTFFETQDSIASRLKKQPLSRSKETTKLYQAITTSYDYDDLISRITNLTRDANAARMDANAAKIAATTVTHKEQTPLSRVHSTGHEKGREIEKGAGKGG